jgi:hypothetical protein
MLTGKWLQPRHATQEAFGNDYPVLDPSGGLDVKCPGCNGYLKLNRKNPAGRSGGWCKNCNRGVAP